MRALALFILALGLAACTTSPPSTPSASSPKISTAKSGAPFPPLLIVSVLPFDEQTRLPEVAWIRKGLPDMITAQLVRVPSVIVMQRARLDEVLREQSFQLSGRVADATAVRVGRLAGATLLVTGTVTAVNDVVRIDAQVLSVEQGIVLGTVSAEGPVAEVTTMARA